MSNEALALVPFKGRWSHLGGKTTDSVVGRLYDPFGGQNQEKPVLKWSRRSMASAEEAIAVGLFLHKSLVLYELYLGREYLVPTSIVVGAKKDGVRNKYKVYIVQPYVDGWDGKNLPDEMRDDPCLIDQWTLLYNRLSHLYNTAKMVNRHLSNGSSIFPITLTVGDSRFRATTGGTCATTIPNTPNILIDKNTLQISLCDFGQYTAWKEDMQEPYSQMKGGEKR